MSNASVDLKVINLAERDPVLSPVPDYLQEIYDWAYLNPSNVRLLDRDWIVSAILWGNNARLRRAAFAEFVPGQRILQPSHVYGGMIPGLARLVGPEGRLDVVDIAPVQVANCRRKLVPYPWARVRQAEWASRRLVTYRPFQFMP